MRADDCPAPTAPAADRPGEREAAVHVLADYTLGDALLTVLWIFGFVIFFWLLILVFSDLFRSHDLSGWAKALWVIFVIFLPYLGVFVYLIARGGKMHEHAVKDQQAADSAFTAYVQQAAGTSASTADELQKLAALRDQGVISPTEFEAQKAKILA
jgi:hypothetical protein